MVDHSRDIAAILAVRAARIGQQRMIALARGSTSLRRKPSMPSAIAMASSGIGKAMAVNVILEMVVGCLVQLRSTHAHSQTRQSLT